jgi:putative transposase
MLGVGHVRFGRRPEETDQSKDRHRASGRPHVVKVRDGQVANRPFYAAIGVTTDGCKDVLGLWAGSGGEGAKFWMSVLVDLKNRGVKDVFFLVCDGLKGLPEVVTQVWPQTIVQTCILHLIRNSFRLTSKKHWDALKRDLKAIYAAANPDAAETALAELEDRWSTQCPAMIRLWRNAWIEFIPFLDYDIEIRRMICSTNAIESLNARYRRAVRARGHFPTEQAAMKCLYLVTRSLDPTGKGAARWMVRWLSRPAARCRRCHRSVSAGRSPNPACAFRRTGLSTVCAVMRGSPSPRGLGSCLGSGNG